MEYLIKSTAILSLFYIFYKLFLQNETFFQSIRSYFLIGVLTAIALPFIVIPEYVMVEQAAIPAKIFESNVASIPFEKKIDWNEILLLSYLLGVAILAFRFLIQLGSLIWLIFTHTKIKEGNYYLIQTEKEMAPFSFFKFIVYNPKKFSSTELDQILIHEKIHVDHWHSLDIIISQIIAIFNWFNPFIWMYNKELRKNLEFIADDFSQYFMQEKKSYQYLLLKTITPNLQMALTNNFYNSLIKKRINMLHKNRSNKTMYFKFAFIIPVLIAFVFTFNTKVIAQQKKVKTEKIHMNEEVELISKDFTKADLEKLKTRLASKGVVLKYKKLKYNSNNEITSISISVDYKDSKANISLNSDNAIQTISIKIDTENNTIALGNISNDLHMKKVYVSSGNKGLHKKIIVKRMGGGDESDEEETIWVTSDSEKGGLHTNENSYVFVSDNDSISSNKFIVKINDDDDMFFSSGSGNSSNVWVSKDGDSTKMKQIKIIEIDEDDDGSNSIFIKRSGSPHEEHDIFIQSGDKKHGNVIFMDSKGAKPLFILDGKEIENGKMDDIDPNNIEQVEVLKGDKAVEEYGDKAKDGVIKITTKKKK